MSTLLVIAMIFSINWGYSLILALCCFLMTYMFIYFEKKEQIKTNDLEKKYSSELLTGLINSPTSIENTTKYSYYAESNKNLSQVINAMFNDPTFAIKNRTQ